jgi:hypothetical protein
MDTSGLTITPIYWAPSGYSFPSSYTTIINQYLTDVAADSGQNTNTYAIVNEYYQSQNGTQTSISYQITAGTPITTSDPWPQTASPCSVNPGYTACVNADQIQSELAALAASNNLPGDLSHMYLLFFPQGVQTFEGGARSQDTYCGIHQSFQLPNNGGWMIYGDEPYLTSCAGGQAPNGDVAADTEVGVMSHEIDEAITDPLSSSPSWFDTAKPGNEIGDECAYNYGPPLGSADPNNPQTTLYNQVINGHKYYTQTIFSNASFNANGSAQGCLQQAYSGGASPTATTTADTDQAVYGQLDASETKLDANGTATSKLTFTVLDGDDEPVSGAHVHFDVNTGDETPTASCGTVSPADGTSDDNGEVQATYTASSVDAACIVIGIDAEDGASDWATIYQGTASDDQPGIDDANTPASLTPGGDAETFSVTASNPSQDDITDARFDLVITGDDNGATGVSASQVHIQYSDSATGGSFMNLPATGDTAKDGEIDADATPDQASDLPAGGSDTVTFHISLDSGAPTSASTGAPLHIETDFDQVNPADGSLDNLDYVTPADVTVTAAGASSGFPVWLIIVLAVIVVLLLGGSGFVIARRRAAS